MRRGPFEAFLGTRGYAVLDGGLATALEAAGQTLDTPLWSGQLVLEAPDAVAQVHRRYLEAGADCVCSAGYQLSVEGLRAAGHDERGAEEALRRAVSLAVEARNAFWSVEASRQGRLEPIVGASAGPYGALLADGSEYDGRYGVGRETLERFHRPRLDVLADTAADVIAFETVPSLLEAEVLAALLGERTGTAAWVSFSCRDGGTLWDGTPIEEAVGQCADVEAVVAVGVNCTSPGHVGELIDRTARTTDLPIIVYPNSGEEYETLTRSWSGTPAAWIDEVCEWIERGARVIGGCCRVGPAEIHRLRQKLEECHAV